MMTFQQDEYSYRIVVSSLAYEDLTHECSFFCFVLFKFLSFFSWRLNVFHHVSLVRKAFMTETRTDKPLQYTIAQALDVWHHFCFMETGHFGETRDPNISENQSFCCWKSHDMKTILILFTGRFFLGGFTFHRVDLQLGGLYLSLLSR